MNDYILIQNLDDKYLTLPELLVKEEEKKDDAEVLDKDGNPIANTGDAAASDNTADGSDTSGLTAKRMNVKLSTMLPIKSSRSSTLSSSKNRTCRQ